MNPSPRYRVVPWPGERVAVLDTETRYHMNFWPRAFQLRAHDECNRLNKENTDA